jgi:heterodisulfide reductase subunit A-like polyferredoxin
MSLFHTLINWCYQVIQLLLVHLFSPNPPQPKQRLRGPRIAVIGAGITGVSSAAHCLGHGYEVNLFEAGDRQHLGGIWSVSTNPLFPLRGTWLIVKSAANEYYIQLADT